MDSILQEETSETHSPKALSASPNNVSHATSPVNVLSSDESSETHSPKALSASPNNVSHATSPVIRVKVLSSDESDEIRSTALPKTREKRASAFDSYLLGSNDSNPNFVKVSRVISPTKDFTQPDEKEKDKINDSPYSIDAGIYKRGISTHARINKGILGGDDDEHISFLLASTYGIYGQEILPAVAHTAARLGIHSIFQRFPYFKLGCDFMFQNGRGDTPLHVAARADQLDIVKCLIDPGQSMRRIDLTEVGLKNNKGNTALHEALEYKHEKVARVLVETYPELLHLPNNEGKTPEYLAAEAGLLQLLEDLWKLAGDDFILPDCEAMTALHAAIIRRHPECLGLVLKLKPQLITVADSKGRNPLHYAASIGYHEGLNELLKIDTQAAYQPDIFGHYPIHEAASAGHIEVIKLFLESCPGSWALPGKGGQSILHVAVQSGKENVVSYILKTQVFEMLINDLDANGDTPLHLATMGSHFKIVRVLISDNRVNRSICNNNNLTALDIAEKNINKGGGSLKRLLILTTLRIANAPRARNLNLLNDEDKKDYVIHPLKPEDVKDRVNILLLVSTLVATVTFAAGFTIPGGLNSDGMATMLTNTKLKAFVICDAIALFCSILAVVSLLWAQLGDVQVIRSVINFTVLLLGISLSMMVIAFSVGLCMVTSRLHWLASAVWIMGTIFLICILIVVLPLRISLLTRYCIIQKISHGIFSLVAFVTGADSDHDKDIRRDYVWNERKERKRTLQDKCLLSPH